MRRWYHTRSKIMPCSHIMKNCWYVVLLCVPVDQNHSACVSCCRRSSAPCTTISRGSCSVTGKHRRRCGKDSYPPLMSQRACGFPRTRKPTSPSGRNTPRRNMRRCLRLEGSSGAPVNEYAFIAHNKGCRSGCPTRPMMPLRSRTRRRQTRSRQASKCCCLLHRLLPSPIAGIMIVSTTCAYCPTPLLNDCAWYLRPRTTHRSSIPKEDCSFARHFAKSGHSFCCFVRSLNPIFSHSV